MLPNSSLLFRITDWKGNKSGSEIRDYVNKIASLNSVHVAQTVQDPNDPYASRILYHGHTNSDPSPASLLSDFKIPPDFGNRISTKVHNSAPPNLSPIGEWSSWGNKSSIQDFLQNLADNGIFAEIVTSPAPLPNLTSLPVSLIQVYACLILLITGIGIARTVALQRELAVQQLHGVKFTVKLRDTLAFPLKTFIGTLVFICAGESAYCFYAYDGIYIAELVAQTALLSGILVIFLILSTSLTVLLYHQIDPLPALQGATPGHSLLLTSWLLHALLLIVVASLTASAFTYSHRLNNFTTYLDQVKNENLSTLQFGGVYTPSQEAEIGKITGQWINEIDQHGEILTAKHIALAHGRTPLEIFYTNDIYLHRNPGQIKLNSDNPDSIHIYRPGNISDEEFKAVVENITFQTNTVSEQLIIHDVKQTGVFPQYDIPTSVSGELTASVNNPVLVVLPQGSSTLTEFALSGNGLYLVNGAKTLAGIHPDAAIKRYLRGITPLSTIANQTVASASRDSITAVFALFTGIATLIIVTLTGVLSYAQYARKRLKIRYLFGWRLSSVYLWFICLEALSQIFLGAWFYREWQAFQAEQNSLIPAEQTASYFPFYSATAGISVSILSFTVFVFSTAFVHYRITRKEVLK